jgi:hypothetical protein
MSRDLRARHLVVAAVLAAFVPLALPSQASAAPDVGGDAVVDSRWFPLEPGTQFVYDGTVVDEEGRHLHRVVFTVTDLVKRVDGRLAVVAWDRDFQDGELAEAELALFVQDRNGDVRTMGEYPEEYEDGAFVGAPSVWVSGLAGARSGVLVPGHPRVGTPPFVQGRAPRVDFFDVGQVVRRGARVSTPAGCFHGVTVVREWSPLAPEDGAQLKFYAPGVGLVRVASQGGDSREDMTLTRVVQLGADALDDARDAALRLDRRGHRISWVWSKTPPAHVRAG